MKTNRLLMAMTFMSVLLFGTSLFAQQEVDPTWYDPWPVANKGAALVPQPQASKSKLEPRIVSGLTKENSAKVRSNRSVNRRTLSQFDLGLCCQPARSLPVAGRQPFRPEMRLSFIAPVPKRPLRVLPSTWESLHHQL